MKTKLIATGLFSAALLPWLIASDASPANSSTNSSAPGQAVAAKRVPSAEERSLLALGDEWIAAEIKKDEPALRRILDDQFVVVYSSGKMADKNAFIAGILRSSLGAFGSKNLYVRFEGDTAVSVDELSVEGSATRTRCMWVALKKDGRWRPIAEQLTKVAVAEPK